MDTIEIFNGGFVYRFNVSPDLTVIERRSLHASLLASIRRGTIVCQDITYLRNRR